MKQYGKWAWIGSGIPLVGNTGGADPNSLLFKNATVFQLFINFIENKIGSTTTPIYFPGSVSVNPDDTQTKVDGFIVAKGDINYQCPCDFTGYSTSFMSMNGNITLGNGGAANIKGTVICLNNNSNVQLNSYNGTITGGVISHGNITMNGDWSIIADTSWQQYVPIEGGTKTVKKVKLIS